MPFKDRVLLANGFSGAVTTQPKVRGLDLELVDGALDFSGTFGLFLRFGARGREPPHTKRSHRQPHTFSLQFGTLLVESHREYAVPTQLVSERAREQWHDGSSDWGARTADAHTARPNPQ